MSSSNAALKRWAQTEQGRRATKVSQSKGNRVGSLEAFVRFVDDSSSWGQDRPVHEVLDTIREVAKQILSER